MQDFNQEENLANWMDVEDGLPAFSQLPDPEVGFGGAGAGASPVTGPPYNWPTYQSNHFANFPFWQRGIQTEQSIIYDNGTSIGSHQTHYDPVIQEDHLPTNQEWLPPQLGLPVQTIVNNHPHIPWNTGIDYQPQLDDTIASHDVSDLVTQDLFDQNYLSFETQSSSPDRFNLPGGPANVVKPVPQQIPQAQPVPASSGTPPTRAMTCSIPWCTKTFRRRHEQVRHEASVHGINQGFHRCQVIGCPSYGRGFSRKDKLTEHMWKKHANLGFVKRVS